MLLTEKTGFVTNKMRKNSVENIIPALTSLQGARIERRRYGTIGEKSRRLPLCVCKHKLVKRKTRVA